MPANIGHRVKRTHRAKGGLETTNHSVALAGQRSELLEESEQIAPLQFFGKLATGRPGSSPGPSTSATCSRNDQGSWRHPTTVIRGTT
jgi:hypothetical protein